jgi:hypothetical protein
MGEVQVIVVGVVATARVYHLSRAEDRAGRAGWQLSANIFRDAQAAARAPVAFATTKALERVGVGAAIRALEEPGMILDPLGSRRGRRRRRKRWIDACGGRTAHGGGDLGKFGRCDGISG